MKKRCRNILGFTLIEVVVVIVIIAILAGILIPSMLNWIEKAKERTLLSEADSIRNAVAAEILELYKDGKDINGTQENSVYNAKFWNSISDKVGKTIQGSDSTKESYLTFTISDKKIVRLTYTSDNLTAVFENNEWFVEK